MYIIDSAIKPEYLLLCVDVRTKTFGQLSPELSW